MNQGTLPLGRGLRHVVAADRLKSLAPYALIWLSALFGVAMAVKMMAFQIGHNVVVAFTVGWIIAMMAGFFFFTVSLVSLFSIAVSTILLWKVGKVLIRPLNLS